MYWRFQKFILWEQEQDNMETSYRVTGNDIFLYMYQGEVYLRFCYSELENSSNLTV